MHQSHRNESYGHPIANSLTIKYGAHYIKNHNSIYTQKSIYKPYHKQQPRIESCGIFLHYIESHYTHIVCGLNLINEYLHKGCNTYTKVVRPITMLIHRNPWP